MKQAGEAAPADERYEALLEMSTLLRRQGKHNEALDALDRARKLEPSRVEAFWRLAELYERFKEPDVARKVLGVVAKRHEGTTGEARALLRMARMESRLEEAKKARAVLREALDIEGLEDGVKGELHAELGRLLIESGRNEEAVVHLKKATSSLPSSGRSHLLLGRALVEQRKCGGAAAHLRKAVELLPEEGEAPYLLARCILRSGSTTTAESKRAYRLAQKAFGRSPRDPDIMFLLARLHLENDLPQPALDLLERVETSGKSIAPATARFWVIKARALSALGAHRRAARVASKAVALDPKDPDALRLQAIELRKAGDYSRAIDCLEGLIEAKPDDAELLVNLAIALEMMGRRAKAVKLLERATKGVDDEGQGSGGLAYLAWIRLRSGDAKKAAALAERAAKEKGPYRLHALDVLAQAQLSLGRAAQAKVTLLKALSMARSKKEREYLRKLLEKAKGKGEGRPSAARGRPGAEPQDR
jgi:tetratricopeptide (TPR) repeat protein